MVEQIQKQLVKFKCGHCESHNEIEWDVNDKYVPCRKCSRFISKELIFKKGGEKEMVDKKEKKSKLVIKVPVSELGVDKKINISAAIREYLGQNMSNEDICKKLNIKNKRIIDIKWQIAHKKK